MKTNSLNLHIDRSARLSVSEQIRAGIKAAIRQGILRPGDRLPSWLTLAAQLGIARGTVKTAYERLVDEQLVVSSRSAGTRVAEHLPQKQKTAPAAEMEPESPLYQDFLFPAGMFQMGIPARDSFPKTTFSRLFSAAARARMSAMQCYADPRGEAELRREIAAQLVLSRGIKCHPSQIFITTGFTGGLGVTLHALGLQGEKVWMENPGFPPARRALELAGFTITPVPVDESGMDVGYGEQYAGDAALAVVTPGQQAPLGVTLSLERRVQLLEWARRNDSWIIEDDYLGELQLSRRAAPALASMDNAGRVIYIGTFSKTISPTLRLGFIVAPLSLVAHFSDIAAAMAPAPDPAMQIATKNFLHDGHFLRHLRKMKRIYIVRSQTLHKQLLSAGYEAHVAGLSVMMRLEQDAQDVAIARRAYSLGIAPSPLSPWYVSGTPARQGLLLGIADKEGEPTLAALQKLEQLIRQR